jgi:hypothetical protein
MAQVTTIFLSSVSAEMTEYRDAVRSACDLLSDVKVVGMESFAAENYTSVETCVKKLASCDLFFGIVGHRYGSTTG